MTVSRKHKLSGWDQGLLEAEYGLVTPRMANYTPTPVIPFEARRFRAYHRRKLAELKKADRRNRVLLRQAGSWTRPGRPGARDGSRRWERPRPRDYAAVRNSMIHAISEGFGEVIDPGVVFQRCHTKHCDEPGFKVEFTDPAVGLFDIEAVRAAGDLYRFEHRCRDWYGHNGPYKDDDEAELASLRTRSRARQVWDEPTQRFYDRLGPAVRLEVPRMPEGSEYEGGVAHPLGIRPPLLLGTTFDCRKCDGCRRHARRQLYRRALNETKKSFYTIFSTLTIRETGAPGELSMATLVEEATEIAALRNLRFCNLAPDQQDAGVRAVLLRHFQNAVKRLRFAGANFDYLACCEGGYGDVVRGKDGKPIRLHIHVLFHAQGETVSFWGTRRHDDENPFAGLPDLRQEWKLGHSLHELVKGIGSLPIDTRPVSYCVKYVSKETRHRPWVSLEYGKDDGGSNPTDGTLADRGASTGGDPSVVEPPRTRFSHSDKREARPPLSQKTPKDSLGEGGLLAKQSAEWQGAEHPDGVEVPSERSKRGPDRLLETTRSGTAAKGFQMAELSSAVEPDVFPDRRRVPGSQTGPPVEESGVDDP